MCINTCAFSSFVCVLSSYVMSLPKVKTFVSQAQSGARRWRYSWRHCQDRQWMTKRELRSLAELGFTSLHHRLRSRSSHSAATLMEGADQNRAGETSVPQASDIQELREKLQMTQEELELVRADLAKQLEQAQQAAAAERADLEEQLRQAQGVWNAKPTKIKIHSTLLSK